jgi:hypothetical protein
MGAAGKVRCDRIRYTMSSRVTIAMGARRPSHRLPWPPESWLVPSLRSALYGRLPLEFWSWMKMPGPSRLSRAATVSVPQPYHPISVWGEYDTSTPCLGKLAVPTQYVDELTKTQVSKPMPVHPTLAAMLRYRRANGFSLCFGRAPRPDDLIAPSRQGRVRSVRHMHRKF